VGVFLKLGNRNNSTMTSFQYIRTTLPRLILLVAFMLIGATGCAADPQAKTAHAPIERVATPTKTEIICEGTPTQFDIRGDWNLSYHVQLHYDQEAILIVEGLGFPRPDTPSTTSHPPTSGGRASTNGEYVRLAVEAETDDLQIAEITAPALFPFCTDCQESIVSVSPDDQTTLHLVSGNSDNLGVWVSFSTYPYAKQLTDYTPLSMRWEWANDSSMLWFESTNIETGTESFITYIGESNIIAQPFSGVLNPQAYKVEFSPKDKSVISRSIDGYSTAENDEFTFYTVDLAKMPYQADETDHSTQYRDIFWNTGTENYLVLREAAENQHIEISAWDNPQIQWMLPLSAAKLVNQNIGSTLSLTELIAAIHDVAISRLGDQLALADGSGGLFVFPCSPID
jgi:hypothetical protein